jgi:hypothetical protein
MIMLLKKIPFFLLLLAIFFCLHGTVENYGYIDIDEVLMTGLAITACMTVLFLIILFFTRNYVFSSLFSFFISLWYLFFGAIHDWIKTISFLSFMRSYTVLLPLIIICTILVAIWLKRKKALHHKLFLYLNMLFLIFCTWDAVLLLNKYSPKKSTAAVPFDMSKVSAKPNVYYLLFDEYPGYKGLQDSFGYRNDSLYDFFQKNDFKVLPTFSNYNLTLFSMSSIFNMQYVDAAEYDHTLINQQDIQQRIHAIRHGEVFSLFRSMGYEVKNFSIFDIGKQKSIAAKNSLFPVHQKLLTDKFFHNRLIKDIGWLFISGRFKIPFLRKKIAYKTDENNRDAAAMLKQQVMQRTATPQFCYAHFLLPHAPYYRDSSGNLNDLSYLKNIYDKEIFLSYLKYTNSVIRPLIQTMVQHDPTAIMVIMSDHGFLHSKTNNSINNPLKFDNICAVRLPGKNFIPYKDLWSNVNFFRWLFNCVYGQQIPYLKDSMIWIND